MALARKLFVNWHKKKRQRSDISASPDSVERLAFLKGDQVPWEIAIIEPDIAGGPNSFTRLEVAGLSLRMAINDTLDDATPLAEQTSWVKDTGNNTFTGTLNLSTAAMNSYITGEKTPYFEIEISDATNRIKVLSELCTVAVGVLPVTSVSPDPLQEYYTNQQNQGIYLPRSAEAGATLILPSLNGLYRVVIGCNDDGTFRADEETT